jgi:tetratricopeptide (TPR) repeat protein
MVAQQSGDYKRAFDMFLKSLETDTNNMISLLGLFQTSCQMGSFEKVTYYLQTYLNMHPGDVSVMYPLAALYMKDGKLEDSRKVLLDILTLDSNNKDAANLLEEVEHNIAQVRQARINTV